VDQISRFWFVALVIVILAGLTIAARAEAGRQEARREDLEGRIRELERENLQLRRQLEQREELHTVTLYFIVQTPTEFFLQPVERRVKKGPDPLATAIWELIKGPEEETRLLPVLPPETKLRNLTVEDGLAVVDLSREATRLNVGARGEELVVGAIVNTLTEFPMVDRVQILIEGKEAETLAGHVDISEPLRRNVGLIRSR